MARASTLLSWDQPFLPKLVEYLVSRCERIPLDLTAVLVVVPTQQAGRRLRQALAGVAADLGTGVLAPQITTPDQLIAPLESASTATSQDTIAAWTVLLQSIELDQYRDVFPSDPPRQNAGWATGLAQQFASLQSQLGENGFDFAHVARRVAGTDKESERWTALSELEQGWKDLLAGKGLAPANAAKLEGVENRLPPTGVKKIVVAGVIDPLPLSVRLLERWAEIISVEVISQGSTSENFFDEWGRVLPEATPPRPLTLPERSCLHVVRDTKEAAALTASLASEYSATPRSLAIGALDQRSLSALDVAFHSRALAAYDPSGVSLGSTGLGLLAVQFLDLVNDTRPVLLAQILRHPEYAIFATKGKGWATEQAELLTAMDTVMNEHLPSDVSTLIRFAPGKDRKSDRSKGSSGRSVDLASAIVWLEDLSEEFRRRPIGKTLSEALSSIVEEREFDLSNEEDLVRTEEIEQLREILTAFSAVEERFPLLTAEASATLLKRAIQSVRRFPKNPPDGWDLQGWLELGYEDAPHLVLVGFNEGSVPETIRGDVFLPNSLREFLGLRSNVDRFRRDLILLEAHLRARAQRGRVDLIVPRMSDGGEPLQPSRLLFRCSDDELVPRAKQLFAELPPPSGAPARRAAWKLKPLPGFAPKSFSPSKLKAYLACPYRYYLKHILKMESVEVGKHELSATSFGNFCHDALERLGKDPAMREITDAKILSAYLAAALEQIARDKLGVVDSFALQVQLESGRARLEAAACVEAEERAQGWRIEHCEHSWTLNFGDMVVNGRIDRIDRNLETGAYRLIDYKTSDSGKPPEEAHWTKYRPTDGHVLPESIFEMNGAAWRWVDLQLPLYLLAMREKFGTAVSAGYFVLPKTKQETAIRLWTQLAPEHLIHSEACTRAIGAAVAGRRFWPPAELRYADDADYLFPDGVQASVDQEAMNSLMMGGPAT